MSLNRYVKNRNELDKEASSTIIVIPKGESVQKSEKKGISYY